MFLPFLPSCETQFSSKVSPREKRFRKIKSTRCLIHVVFQSIEAPIIILPRAPSYTTFIISHNCNYFERRKLILKNLSHSKPHIPIDTHTHLYTRRKMFPLDNITYFRLASGYEEGGRQIEKVTVGRNHKVCASALGIRWKWAVPRSLCTQGYFSEVGKKIYWKRRISNLGAIVSNGFRVFISCLAPFTNKQMKTESSKYGIQAERYSCILKKSWCLHGVYCRLVSFQGETALWRLHFSWSNI